MKALIVVIVLVICIVGGLAGPVYRLDQTEDAKPQIINYQNDNYGIGPYNFM